MDRKNKNCVEGNANGIQKIKQKNHNLKLHGHIQKKDLDELNKLKYRIYGPINVQGVVE
jgi:hypothetical protein